MNSRNYLFSIAAVAAMALTAFIGAGSASATVLCSESATTECASFEKGSIVAASLTGSTTLSTTGGTVLDTCTSGMIEATTKNNGGSSETVSASIDELAWESCTQTTDTISKGELEIHHISGSDNGTVTGKSISFTVNSALGTCTYGTGEALDLGTLKGGNPATLEINAVLVKTAGGFACPADAKWVASYSVTFPELLYVGASAAAGLPKLSLENTGGPPKAGTRKCEFAARFEVCKFTVTNNSAFAVIITIQEITGTAGRYNIINAACAKGTEIAAGKTCTGEIRLEVNPGVNWVNGYLIQVEEKGSGGKNKNGIYGFLTT